MEYVVTLVEFNGLAWMKLLLKGHVIEALNDEKFARIFKAIKERENFDTDEKVIALIQESYKASVRTERF